MAGRAGRDADVSERGDLSVERVPIRLDPVRVARAALPDHVELPGSHIRALDLVRGVTVSTDWSFRVALREGGAVNARGVLRLDPFMTPTAGGRDVRVIHAAARVGFRPDVVIAVAARTVGRDEQSALAHRATVNAVLVE